MSFLMNPFYTYSVTWGIVFFVYLLGWSLIYPPLSQEIFIFFLVTCIYTFTLGRLTRNAFFSPCDISSSDMIRNKYDEQLNRIIFFMVTGAIIEFLYSGAVPLYAILRQTGYIYAEFGVPTFHVLLVTYISYISLRTFYLFLIFNNRKYLFTSLLALSYFILIFNRASVCFIALAMVVIYIRKKNISHRTTLKLMIGSLLALYLFGVAGNYRFLTYNPNLEYSNQPIMTIGKASKDFTESNIPKEFFWGYLYISSPLSNVQYSAQIASNDISADDLILTSFVSVVPDFIQKRIIQSQDIDVSKAALIDDSLNVSSMYGLAVTIAGYYGLLIMFIVWLSFIFLNLFIFNHTDMLDIVMAILIVITLFSSFVNMITFSGWSFQLIICALFLNRRLRHTFAC